MTSVKYQVFTLLLLVLVILNSAGCAAPATPAVPEPGAATASQAPRETLPPADQSPPETQVIATNTAVLVDAQRETPPPVGQGLLDQQVAANNTFAFELYRTLRVETGNLFYSPYSLSTAMAMTYAGARGETEKQISAALHYVLPQDQLHPVFNLLDQTLNVSAGAEPGFQLSVVNSLWGQEQFPFLPDFLNLIARNYGAEVQRVDFTLETNRNTARQTINDWVSQRTNAKIPELLSPGMLNDLTRLVLVNAIYFVGEWQSPFMDGTNESSFNLLDGQQVNVPMMSRRADAPYFQGEGCQAVGLPYKGDRAEMIIIVPDAGKFSEFEQALNQEAFDRILAGLEDHDVKLFLPKFQFSYGKDMKNSFAELGMPAAFDPAQADFSGMYDQQSMPDNLFISHIAHQAFVKVDEKGTEAAAATGVIAEVVSMPLMLRVDRPFIFIIRDRQTGSILFVGRVLDPRT